MSSSRRIIDKGLTLGYGFAEADTDISKEKTETLIELVSEVVIGNMSDVYRDAAYSRKWTTQKEHTFTARFVYILVWKWWAQEAVTLRNRLACAQCEKIWGPPDVCVNMAVEARVNDRMSKVVRCQAKAWGDEHRIDMEIAERIYAENFANKY